MVRVPEPQRGSPAVAQRRKMERMLPCTERAVSMLEGARRIIKITEILFHKIIYLYIQHINILIILI